MCFTKLFIRIGLVLVICGSVSAQPPEQKPAGGSVIKGRVIYADTGQPLRRAGVSLLTREGVSWASSTVSDRNGEFVFNDVSAGTYFAVVDALDIVSPFSFLTGSDRSMKLILALAQIDDGFSEVTVDGHSSVKTEIRAIRGGVITGRVLTETDEPIAKAQITLYKLEHGKLYPATRVTGLQDSSTNRFQTDSRGVYRIAGLATGEYVVRAAESNEGGDPGEAAEGSYTDGSMMVAFYPQAVKFQDATSIKVQQGAETKDVDIRFIERSAYRISGTVSLRGRPVASAEIRLARDEPELRRDPFDPPPGRSDDKGQWEIRAVPDGKYTLSVSGTVGGMIYTDGEGVVWVAPALREINVEGSDITNFDVELFDESKVSGVIAVEGKAPRPERMMIKLDPISNVQKTNEVLRNMNELTAFSSVNQKGEFEIRRLPAGLFQFGFMELDGYSVKSITHKGKDLLRNPVKLRPGQTLSDVNIVLTSEIVSLSGRVVEKDDKSKLISTATVLLFPVEPERRRMTDEPIAVYTDKDGRFTVKAAAGEYFVFVIDRRRKDVAFQIPSEASFVKKASRFQKIKLERGAEKRVVEVVGP